MVCKETVLRNCVGGEWKQTFGVSTELITKLGNLATIKLNLRGDVSRMDADKGLINALNISTQISLQKIILTVLIKPNITDMFSLLFVLFAQIGQVFVMCP